MDINQRKELFSKAFMKAIAAQIGLRTAEPDVDDDSIDIIIRGRGFRGAIRNPQLDIQLKCTANAKHNDDSLSFALPLKNYNDLRGENIVCPRYLFVFVVPEKCEDWLLHDLDFCKIQHCGYWFSLLNMPNVSNSTSVTVKIPKSQRLTAATMHDLMEQASDRIMI